jgi:aminoglycoside 6-adenylyltransferase
MRSESEMYELILGIARADERIRAVVLNGSRANPNAPGDVFQDFDVIYVVTELDSFKGNPDWFGNFGERMIFQFPDDMGDPSPEDWGGYGVLMQFADGNRIDLGLVPLENMVQCLDDSLSVALLDKDGILPDFPEPDESGYLPEPPTAKAFDDCCNEFWWVSTYVVKGLWRDELLYARFMLDEVVRSQLMKMLEWHIGLKTCFKINPGKFGKYYQKYLEPPVWEQLLRTYAAGTYEATWQALFEMGEMFRSLALPLAAHYGFEYPHDDDARVWAHLHHVRNLPHDAAEMY